MRKRPGKRLTSRSPAKNTGNKDDPGTTKFVQPNIQSAASYAASAFTASAGSTFAGAALVFAT